MITIVVSYNRLYNYYAYNLENKKIKYPTHIVGIY